MMKILFLIVNFCLFQPIICQVESQDSSQNCTKLSLGDEYKIAYPGWPHVIACNLVFGGKATTPNQTKFYWEPSNINDYNSKVLCQIKDDKEKIVFKTNTTMGTLGVIDTNEQNIGYFIPEINKNSTYSYTINIWITTSNVTKCLTMQVDLNLTEFKQVTCEEFISSEKILRVSSDIGASKHFYCSLNSKMYPKVYENPANRDDFDFKWLRNCSSVPNNTNVLKSHSLQIIPVSFDDSGVYTCSVTHKGMTRYLTFQAVCTQNKLTKLQPTLTCSNPTIQKNIGQDAVFECEGNFGEGQINGQHEVIYHWKKIEVNSTTLNQCYSKSSPGAKTSCTYQIHGGCYMHVPTQAERQKQLALVPVQLHIKNIQASDYGTYVMWVGTNIGKFHQVNVTLTLAQNLYPKLFKEAEITGIAIGLILLFVVLAGVAFYYQIYILVYYKRYFGPYAAGAKQYGAVFQYNFSQELDTFAQDDVKVSVKKIREILENMGFSVYDENRDGYLEHNRAENIRVSIERSHRLIILLTLDFIKDGWSMLALQKGFDKMIQSGSKLVFILLPGMKEYLKQHAKQDDTCCMIQRAIEINCAIHWSNKKNFNKKRFCFNLEHAMPKLDPKASSRPESLSSKDDMMCDYKDPEYFRSISNETNLTILATPGSESPNTIVLSDDKNKNKILTVT